MGMNKKKVPRLIWKFPISFRDIEKAGEVANKIKKRFQNLGMKPEIVRRVSIICFEGEMNLVLFAEKGGLIRVEVFPDRIDIFFEDEGPGIKDINLALTPGYSTAPEWAVEMGFGAGMGLYNIKKNSDFFEIFSEVDKKTMVHSRIFLTKCKDGSPRRSNLNES